MTFQNKLEEFKKIKMALNELRFNGHNGHSRIKVLGGEEITVPLMWDDLKILPIPKSDQIDGETQKEFFRWIIESNKPKSSMYFACSDDYQGLYLGVQYYCAGYSDDPCDKRIPVGSPKILTSNIHYDNDRFIKHLAPGATGYIHQTSGSIVVVQPYKQM